MFLKPFLPKLLEVFTKMPKLAYTLFIGIYIELHITQSQKCFQLKVNTIDKR